jgi:molybdate-binding protein/DNA-binding XRE family transcriptional regulator
MDTRTHLHHFRQQRGLSAAQVAKLAGVSRQTIYAIEAGDYVPNTTLALQLAQILEVRVEDLFALEAAAAPPAPPVTVDMLAPAGTVIHKGQPVQLCRVGKRTLAIAAIPQAATLPMADGIVVESSPRTQQADVHVFPDGVEDEKRLLIAGCDPGISLLAQYLARFEGVDLIVAQSSSQQALDWLRQGKAHVAGTHLRDAASGEYNLPVIRRLFPKGEVKVVTFAIWEQGLVVAEGNPKGIRGIADLARKNVRIVNREQGAGSRELLDLRLADAGIRPDHVRGYQREALGHLAAALAVHMKEADCCVATRSAARAFGLSFLPLATERYDLVIRRAHARLPAVEALVDVLNRSAIRRKLELLAGYDTSHTGEVLAP